MHQDSLRIPTTTTVRLVGLALTAILAAWLLAPAAVGAATAPVVAQAGACGDQPCAEAPPAGEGACGAQPCGEVPPGASACGDRPCSEVPVENQSPCGDKPCGEVPPEQQNPCGDKPCGEVSAEEVNNPAAVDEGAQPEEAGEQPADTTPGQEGFQDGGGQQALDGEETGSGGSGLVLPLLFVAAAGLVLFWVVRRNRDTADSEVDAGV